MRHNLESLLYDFIVDNNIATVDEVELVTNINGYSEESLNDIIHCRTEYHDVPQLYACEPEGYYFSDELLEEYDWWGRPTIEPKKFDTLWDAIVACAQDVNDIIVTLEKGILKVQGLHHDGTNVFTIHREHGYFWPKYLF